jgi:hypothetical protein
MHIENELHPVRAQSNRILGQELLLPLDLFAIEKSPVVAAEIGKTERDLVAANHADHGMTAADNIVARRVERYIRPGIAADDYFVQTGKRNMFDLIGLGAGKMTDDDLFHTVIAHGAVSPTASKIYLQMLLRISSRLTAQHTLCVILTPFCHLGQTLALPRVHIAFAEPARRNRLHPRWGDASAETASLLS